MKAFLWVFLALLGITAALATNSIDTEIDRNLPSGKAPPISARDLRTVLHDMNAHTTGDVFYVTDYGALCDGSGTDDSAAINSAISAARAKQAANGLWSVTIQFPANGICTIKSTLNFTGHHSPPNTPFGVTPLGVRVQGGNIECRVTAGPCLDALGSLSMTFSDMSICPLNSQS